MIERYGVLRNALSGISRVRETDGPMGLILLSPLCREHFNSREAKRDSINFEYSRLRNLSISATGPYLGSTQTPASASSVAAAAAAFAAAASAFSGRGASGSSSSGSSSAAGGAGGTLTTTIPTARLENIGNSCYMNAALQLLAPLPGFKQRADEIMDVFLTQPEPQDAADIAARKRTADFFISFDDALKLLWVERPSAAPIAIVEPTALRAQLRAPFNGALQQDAEEFILYILDRLETDAGCAPTLAWQSVFLGETTSTTKCSGCDNPPAPVKEQFLNLKLSVPSDPSPAEKLWLTLERLILRNYQPKELLTGADRFQCTFCKSMNDAERSTSFSILPPVLLITLSRFDIAAGKIMTSVPFCRKMVLAGETYDLAGMIVHRGSTQNSGHYFSYVRSPQFPGYSNWFCVNDRFVTPMTDSDIDKVCIAFKSTSFETPYILAFNKRV